ncbi:MAG: dihydroorotase [Clostridiales Family XIII bacterium]|jgi:dihydroorotase|nr:dihydroorotase [Clostridiales Family XIII bacterium]
MIIINNIRIATCDDEAPATVVIDEGRIVSIRRGAGDDRPIHSSDTLSQKRMAERSGGAGFSRASDVIDGTGLCLSPGFVDLHVHFRDPGYTAKEDIGSGSRAAARGGYTTVCCMPNTSPVIDSAEAVRYVDGKGRSATATLSGNAPMNGASVSGAGVINLFAVGALTVGQRGETLADISGMNDAATLCRALTGHGIAGVTEDGRSLMDEGRMREAMCIAKSLGLLVMDHTEDSALSGGCINEGRVSVQLGLKGVPARAETNIIERDIRLASETGARIHIQHVSTAGSVALIRAAKADGVPITAETAPHYFALTENILSELPAQQRAMAKMNPPLRTEADRAMIIEGLADGTIDCIATDHAPHEAALKALPLDEAPFGIVGLETAFAISYTELVKNGHLTLPHLIEKMSTAPARLIGLDRGEIREGAAADLVLLDINAAYRIDSADFASKSRNTPFEGRTVCGCVRATIHGGDVVYNAVSLPEQCDENQK